ncbi:general APC amino acid permease, partial [Pisolithus marmoratus]
IAGTLGTGLFLGSGRAPSGAGPVGALLVYALVGTVAYSSLCSLGEMTCHAPISGTFPHFAARWVDPAFGFAKLAVLNSLSHSGTMTRATFNNLNSEDTHYFQTNHLAIYTAVISCLVILINVVEVRYATDTHWVLGSLIRRPVSLITGLILAGLVIDLGGAPNHQRLGFQYWKKPGVLAGAGLVPKHIGLDRFLGMLSVLVRAGFSLEGMELVAVYVTYRKSYAASETENRRRNIAKAVRRVFYRICIFYLLGIFTTGLLVPYDDPDLLQTTGNAAQSPYVIAMNRAGIKVLPSIINAGVLTSAFSASNSYLFCSSRILYGLSLRGQVPRIFARCTSSGLPIVAIGFTGSFAFLSLMNISSGSATVFNWLVNSTAVGGFFTWASINLTYIFFCKNHRGLRAQGIGRKERLHYWNPLQPGLAIWGLTWCTFFILINGFTVFWSFDASEFFTAYINIPIFFGLYTCWKIIKRTKVWKPKEMYFVTGIPPPEETESPESPPTTFWRKVAAVLF